MISFRGHAQQWCIFRMASASQLKWKMRNSTGHQQKHSVIFKKSVIRSQHRRGEFMNERVKVLSQRCCYVSSRFFKLVYGNPWPLLVGIRRIPAYHVDYTTALIYRLYVGRQCFLQSQLDCCHKEWWSGPWHLCNLASQSNAIKNSQVSDYGKIQLFRRSTSLLHGLLFLRCGWWIVVMYKDKTEPF